MMILQGVGHPVPYLGVLYANDPKKGGYMAYAPALDLTTLFEVICLSRVEIGGDSNEVFKGQCWVDLLIAEPCLGLLASFFSGESR